MGNYLVNDVIIEEKSKKIARVIIFYIFFSSFIVMVNINHGFVQAGTVIPGGSITSDTTWTLANSPYWIQNEVTVEEGVTLTIEPGVEVKFRKDLVMHLEVKGNLIAIGTPNQIINFTSNETSPGMKDWGNIWIYSTGNASLEYVNITYGNIGVYIFFASNVTVENSTVLYCERGIKIDGSGNNYVYGNTLSYNQAGVQLDNCQNASVINNTISDSVPFGVYSTGSINNYIYHNNFLNNVNQAVDDSNGNIWNDSYPSGGNFWSDWSPVTPDLYNGSITPQTTGLPDGICDSQYGIDADSIDYYPLKYPFGSPPPDFELPTIEDVLADPDPQEVFDSVNISAIVSDNDMVDEVWINITGPTGSTVGNFSMEYNTTDDRYYYPSSYDSLGDYAFTIWVNDMSSNWNFSSGLFTISDSILPTIENAFANPNIGEIYDLINISATILDNYALQDIWINITFPNGSQSNITMTKGLIDEFYLNQSYDQIGIYDFTIWVNDTSNNWNFTSGSFDILDSTSPSITNLNVNPGSQAIFGFVNISSNVTDNYELNTVWINISYPNGSWINTTMNMALGNLFYTNQSYDLAGIYGFTIWANDTSNNWNLKSGFFIIGDSTPPEINNVLTIPDIQEVFGNVNVSAIVTDNVGLFGVWVNITLPDGSSMNITMDKATGDLFYSYQTFNTIGIYDFKIWANDSNDNWNFSSGFFTIQDTIPPQINNVVSNPSIQEIYDDVNVTAMVIDNYDLGEVWVNITYPDGSFLNLSMNEVLVNEFYLDQSYDQIGIYDFTIWANDTSNIWNSSFGSFNILDTNSPSIDNMAAIPGSQDIFGYVNISSEVIDNFELYDVWVNISYPNGSWVNVSMEIGSGNWFFLNQSYAQSGVYNFMIWANDTSNNWNQSSGFFVIGDTEPPVITNVISNPDAQEVFSNVNISAQIVDNYDLSSVWINITGPDGSSINITIDEAIGNEFYIDQNYDQIGVYSFIIWANDSSDNWNSSFGFFRIEDNSIPSINNINTNPDIQVISGYVNISSIIIDNFGIYDVWVNVTYPDGSFNNITMDKGLFNAYFLNQSYNQVGIYNYVIWTNDTSNNWNFDIGSFQIIDLTIPYSYVDIISPYWKNTLTFEIKWTASDNTGLSNITLHYRFSSDNSSWGSWTEYSFNNSIFGTSASGYFQFIANQDGYYEFFVNSSDIDYNWEPNPFVAEAIAALDTTPPSSSMDISKYWHTLTSLTVNIGTEDSLPSSGIIDVIKYYRFSLDNISWGPWEEYLGDDREGYYEFYSIAYDYAGNVESKSTRDTLCAIDNSPPLANAGEDRETEPDTLVYFDGSGSNDNFGVIDNYTWTLTSNSVVLNVLYGLVPVFHFDQIGNYQVTLTVKDRSGNIDQDTITIVVFSDLEAPSITHSADPEIQEVGDSVNITAIVIDNIEVFGVWIQIFDPDHNEIVNISMNRIGLSDNYSYNNLYLITGNYEYVIWANDTSDNWAFEQGSFVIQDSTPPSASAGENINTKVNKKVIFDGSESSDNVGITNYTWNITRNGDPIITLYEMNPSYEFKKDGRYDVVLTVRDASGNIGEDTIFVKVESVESDLCWLFILICVVIGLIVLFIIWKKYNQKEPAEIKSETEISPDYQSESIQSSEDEPLVTSEGEENNREN